MNEYSPVIVTNNWGRIKYTCNGEEVRPGPARVRFPDGSRDDVIIDSRPKVYSVNDHGHVETGVTTELGLNRKYHEVPIWVPLQHLEILPQEPSWVSKRPSEWTEDEKQMIREWLG